MKQGLIKGPWSKQEDEILKEYVETYGPKNWNAVQRLTGLARDGKSCRFRWLNQLDPCLKKGKLSEEEKQKILQLRQLGGDWCEIVKQLPGRTDNGIKNFFNINERKKRKMENDNGECRKKKKNNLSLKDEITKSQDNELKDNGENSLSGFMSNQQQDIPDTHEMELVKDICNINHPSDSFHIPIMQPSNMSCNNVASSSLTFIDRGEAPFMPIGMLSNFPPLIEIDSPQHLNTFISNNSPLDLENVASQQSSQPDNSMKPIIDINGMMDFTNHIEWGKIMAEHEECDNQLVEFNDQADKENDQMQSVALENDVSPQLILDDPMNPNIDISDMIDFTNLEEWDDIMAKDEECDTQLVEFND